MFEAWRRVGTISNDGGWFRSHVPRLIMGNAPSHIRSQHLLPAGLPPYNVPILSQTPGKWAFQSKPEDSVTVTDRYVTKIVGDPFPLTISMYGSQTSAQTPYPLPQVHCPWMGTGWPRGVCEATTRADLTVSPPSPPCLHPQRPTSLPLNHVIGFKYVLIIIHLRNPLRDSFGQVHQTNWTRPSQPPTGCRHR